ncbi:hypothetical protein VTL71DRAFT_8884 [Oculimacula yallundae]|uniref:Uncharacterized protein n=1 Tax=Oculimacula yallundae TaxID=86028 RepID=A0ABR4BT50_9HELO
MGGTWWAAAFEASRGLDTRKLGLNARFTQRWSSSIWSFVLWPGDDRCDGKDISWRWAGWSVFTLLFYGSRRVLFDSVHGKWGTSFSNSIEI